jgi:hypothetical protein
MGKSIDKIKSALSVIWGKLESFIFGMFLFVIVFGAIALEANRDNIQKNIYPKKIELGLGDNIKSSLVKVGNHEYMVTTYTTKVGSGIATVHNQDCRYCKSARDIKSKVQSRVNLAVSPGKYQK